MAETKLYVELLAHTPSPQNVVAMGAKLCYSSADIHTLQDKITDNDQSEFLKKLIDMDHMSPLEHTSFTFGVQGISRALLAQITRHRLASFSVKSQRYVDHAKDAGFSYVVPNTIKALGEEAIKTYKTQMETMNSWYTEWCEKLGADKKEDARFVLPNAAETKLIMTANVRELLHIFELRCCNRAQWEIRALCWNMLGLCLSVAPELFAKAGARCCFKPCDQGVMSCTQAHDVAMRLVRLKAFVAANAQTPEFSQRLSEWANTNIV